ncbi:MAG: Hpt domain-containing protein [Oscillospiraceae bacterium]|nr:Hpt domain-containing protein [Oscillospiraceae bacterium]
MIYTTNTTQNNLLTALKEIGVDVDGTVSRFMNNSEIYIKFLARFPDEDRITPIYEAIAEKDYEKLLSAAHKLKGVTANLGMTALSAKAAEIVAKVRNDIYDGFEEDAAEVERLSNQVCDVIRANI